MKVVYDECVNNVMVLKANELILQSKIMEMNNEIENLRKSCLCEASHRGKIESELEKCLNENIVLRNEV